MPGRAIQQQGFQLRQTGLAVTEEAALRVVRASLHKGQQQRLHDDDTVTHQWLHDDDVIVTWPNYDNDMLYWLTNNDNVMWPPNLMSAY